MNNIVLDLFDMLKKLCLNNYYAQSQLLSRPGYPHMLSLLNKCECEVLIVFMTIFSEKSLVVNFDTEFCDILLQRYQNFWLHLMHPRSEINFFRIVVSNALDKSIPRIRNSKSHLMTMSHRILLQKTMSAVECPLLYADCDLGTNAPAKSGRLFRTMMANNFLITFKRTTGRKFEMGPRSFPGFCGY